jgi:4-amino-4-deoxy-L-arabinose transferase-like glycosyltransferase
LPALLLVAVTALGWDLGGYRLLDPDEGRNAEVAREMAASNDYLVPHLDGLPYLDKPVVYFAAAATTMEVLGPTEVAARLPAYLATLATIALLVWFARRRWGPAAGWLAGIAIASMPMVLAYARTAIFDSTLSLFITAAILSFAEQRPVVAWAALGAGALTKGPIAIAIPLAAVLPYAWLTGQSARRFFPWRGLLVFALVALPWFLAVSARIPEFPHYVFVRETFERMTTHSFHRSAPFWYYFPIIPVAAFPWIIPALARLGGGRLRWAWEARQVNPSTREAILLASWVLGPLVLLTLNQSKLPQYVLPLMPAFALAAARSLTRQGAGYGARAYAWIAAGLIAALVASIVWFRTAGGTWTPLTPAEHDAIPPVAIGVAVSLLASAIVVRLASGRRNVELAAAGYAIVVIALSLVIRNLMTAVGDERSAAGLAEAVRGRGRVMGIAAYPPSLPFYLQRTVPVATGHGRELTSNYIADYVDRYRAAAGSPLLSPEAWRDTLARCAEPTVFVVRTGDQAVRSTLAPLPVLFADRRYVAYGPCTTSTQNNHSAFRNRQSAIGVGWGVGTP